MSLKEIRGVHYFEVIKNNRKERIGFTYTELLSNMIQDGGGRGISVREIRAETGLADKTIYKTLEKLVKMNRIIKRKVPSPNKLPNFRYYPKRQWIDVL